MSTVWKWEVGHGFNEFDMPVSAKIRHADSLDLDSFSIWAEVNPTAPTERRAFQFFGTGQPIPKGLVYVATSILMGGQIVWHLYEIPVRTSPDMPPTIAPGSMASDDRGDDGDFDDRG